MTLLLIYSQLGCGGLVYSESISIYLPELLLSEQSPGGYAPTSLPIPSDSRLALRSP